MISPVGSSGYAPQYFRDSIALGAFGALPVTMFGFVFRWELRAWSPYCERAPWILTGWSFTIDREFPADVILGDGRVFGGVFFVLR